MPAEKVTVLRTLDATLRALRLKPVTTVLAGSPCADAVETMREKGFDQLPVLATAGGKLVGLVTLGNIMSYISCGRATGKTLVSEAVFDFSKIPEVVTDCNRYGEGRPSLGLGGLSKPVAVVTKAYLPS